MLAHDSSDLVMVRPLGGADDEATDVPIGVAENGDGRLQPPITLSLDRKTHQSVGRPRNRMSHEHSISQNSSARTRAINDARSPTSEMLRACGRARRLQERQYHLV